MMAATTGRIVQSKARCSRLTTAVFDEIGLPSSAGISTSKVVAKVASALAKPRGVMLVPAGVERAVLALRCRCGPFPGIGPGRRGEAARRGLRDRLARSPKRRSHDSA